MDNSSNTRYLEKPIHILHECGSLDQGGVETLLVSILRNIDREKVQFDFLLHRKKESFYEKEVIALGSRIYKTTNYNPFNLSRFKHECLEALASSQHYQIIHAHTEMNLWPLKYAKQCGIPIRIAHSHNAKCKLSIKYFFLLYERIFIHLYANRFFACSKLAALWSYGKKQVEKGNVFIIKNGIDSKDFKYDKNKRQIMRESFGLDDSKIIVGHVGRFVKQKNHSMLIDIIFEMKKKNNNVVLLMVGSGKLEEKIKQKCIKCGLKENVFFLGNRADVCDVMQAFDVFVMPSYWEGLPLVGIEAQASGLPLVISDTVSEEVKIIDEVYFKSLKEGANKWASFIFDVISNHIRRDTTAEIINAGYDIKNTAQLLQEYYLQIMAS